MIAGRAQNGRELAMVFEQQQPLFRDAVHGRSCAEHALADGKMACAKESPRTPVEAAAAVTEPRMSHEFKQLAVTDKPRVADLLQQGNVAVWVDDEAVLGVAHDQQASVECSCFDEFERRPMVRVSRQIEPPNAQPSSHPI